MTTARPKKAKDRTMWTLTLLPRTHCVLQWIIVCTILSCQTCITKADQSESEHLEPWQECSIFSAPTSLTTGSMGWGVFAGRDFAPGEVVEILPMFLPVLPRAPEILNSILDEYIYGYHRIDFEAQELVSLNAVLLGMGMVYNHHPEPNVRYTSISREPFAQFPNAAMMTGFVARRHIHAGEELFSSYGEDDGGAVWFANRNIPLQAPNDSKLPNSKLDSFMAEYCSHVHAGPGLPAWRDRVLPILPPQVPFTVNQTRLAPADAGYGRAIAKHNIQKGDRIEITPALLLSKKLVEGTLLAPLAIAYQDLNAENQKALQEARDVHKTLVVQHQSDATDWKRIDDFTSLEDFLILPVLGSIGLVQRVGGKGGNTDKAANCRLVIHPMTLAEGAVGVTIELIATKQISVGQRLRLDHPSPDLTSSKDDQKKFLREMALTGQYYFAELKAFIKEPPSKDEL